MTASYKEQGHRIKPKVLQALKNSNNFIKKEALLQAISSSNERAVREAIRMLIVKDGEPIISLPHGYLYVRDSSDPRIMQSVNYLRQKALSLFERAKIIIKNCNDKQLTIKEFFNGKNS
jgi:transcriptional regulator of NAD metabolism